MLQKKLDRRNFLKVSAGAVGAGLTLGSGCSFLAPSNNIPRRQVLVSSDLHIGYIEDGLDGEAWFSNALLDIDSLGTIDYALVLGDIAHNGMLEEFQKYLSLREKSNIARWYEVAGNHEYMNDEIEAFSALICPDMAYMVSDGNLMWFFLSDEISGPEGNISEKTFVWLIDMISHHQDKIIIVCSHQCVYGTVRDSTDSVRYIYPKEMVAEILDAFRIDLWLCGHQHYYPYSWEDIYFNGKTTFVNVSSVNHAYDTNRSESFILVIKQDAREIIAYRRSHDLGLFESEFTVNIPVTFPIQFSDPFRGERHSCLSFSS